MSVPDELKIILDRIANHEHGDTDIAALRQIVTQKGKYAANVGQGRDIHIGDRIYRGADAKAIRTIVRSILEELPFSTPTPRERVEQALLKAVASEVESRLEQSLHNKVYIELDKEQDPNQVQTPWDMELKTSKNPSEQLPAGTKIERIFDRDDINGRLLILGAPGSGKTTTLLELAKVLVVRAQKNPELPVPVLLNLSSWKEDKQSIADWMATALKLKSYGFRVDICKRFVVNGRILPLLEGLDELASDRQEGCVQKINEFLQEWMGNLVVCSRIEEYQHYEALLGLNNSIVLQPLRREQIRDYVQSESLWQLIEADSDLMELAQIPLMLNMMVVASVRLNFQQWQQLVSSQERLDYLFEAYINTVLGQPRGQDPSLKQTRRWLGWLATQLIQDNETEFLIEKIQPYWLESKIQRLTWGLMVALIWGLILGPIGGLIYGLTIALSMVIIAALIWGPISWLIESEKNTENLRYNWWMEFKKRLVKWLEKELDEWLSNRGIETGERLKWDWNKAKTQIIYGLIIGLIYGSIISIVSRSIHALILAPIYGLTHGLTKGFLGTEIKNKISPNQGIKQSCINLIPLSAIAYFPSVATVFLLGKIVGLYFGWYILLTEGLVITLIISISQNNAFIMHFALRLVLWWSGYAPWNYAKFLDYATKHLLMQRVGGGYRFLHDLLRQHFAKHYG